MSSSPDPTETRSSGAPSEHTLPTIINEGSLSLAEFVQRLETPGHKTVELTYWRKKRGFRMPVSPPQGGDRFAGRGHELVENLAYERAGRERLSIHGILEFSACFLDGRAYWVEYHF